MPPLIQETGEDLPERPRLGIGHLLVCTALVAVWLGAVRSAVETMPRRDNRPMMVAAAVFSPAMGAGLGGLLLCVAWPRRGLRFPVYPGEYLLVIHGSTAILVLTMCAFVAAAHACGGSGGPAVAVVAFLLLIAMPLLSCWAFQNVREVSWRIFFATIAVSQLWLCVGCLPVVSAFALLRPVASLYLVALVIGDRRRGVRCPWPHWAGLVAELWIWLAFAVLVILGSGAALGRGM